jgi:general secretion pathway protein D
MIGVPARQTRVIVAVALFALFLAAGCATTHPAFDKGRELLSQDQWEDAIAQIELAVREQPRSYEYRAAAIDARRQAVNELARQGAALREAGRFSEAEASFRRILRLQPDESRALAGLTHVAQDRRHAALLQQAETLLAKSDLAGAETITRSILVEVPKAPRALALLKRIEERKPRPSAAPPAVSAAMKKPITLQFRDANLRIILDVISRESGINFVLDRDIRPDTRATILVQNTPIDQAIDTLIASNGLARKMTSDGGYILYPNTPQKARDYQELVIRNFYLSSADAKQMLTMLRTILKSQSVFIDERRNVLVMRDTPEAVQLAERLIAAHDQTEPEVMLDVEILEVGRSRSSNIGLQFPEKISLGVADPITLSNLNNVDSSGINVTGLQSVIALNLRKLFTNVNLLANPRIRVRNKEKAKIHVGDRVPVISSTISATTALSTQTVNYLDVGIKLEVEPQVLDEDVVIKVNLEVSSLGQQVSVQNSIAYQIGTRNANTTLTLKDGETQILGGLIQDNERDTANKVPGLGELPVLGRLFSNQSNALDKTEIVLSITPRILRRMERPSSELAEYWSGPETNLRTAVGSPVPGRPGAPVINVPGGGFIPGAPGAPPKPVPPVAPGAGPTVPGGAVVQPSFAPPAATAPGSAGSTGSVPAQPAAPASPFSAPPAFVIDPAPGAPTTPPAPAAPAPNAAAPPPAVPSAPAGVPDIIFQPPPGVGR